MKFSHLKKLLVLMFAGGGMLAQTSAALITVETVPRQCRECRRQKSIPNAKRIGGL